MYYSVDSLYSVSYRDVGYLRGFVPIKDRSYLVCRRFVTDFEGHLKSWVIVDAREKFSVRHLQIRIRKCRRF